MSEIVANVSLLIRCPARQAFDAFADADKITQFWLQSTSGPLTEGARVSWHFMVPGAVDTVTVQTVDAPRRIDFTWSDGSTVRLAFAELAPQQTRVSAQVSNFGGDDAVAQALNVTEGFTIVLCDLKTWLESGRSAHLVRDKGALIAAEQAGGASA